MNNLFDNKTLKLAVEKWGKERRNDGGADKSARLGHVAEKMADVFIMLNQLIIIFNNKDKVQECRKRVFRFRR